VRASAVPDPLMRFADTPYRFSCRRGALEVSAESNDLGVALALRRFALEPVYGELARRWKLIVDRQAPTGTDPWTVLRQHPVTLLLAGVGTCIIFDAERAEVFGFAAPGLSEAKLSEMLSRVFTEARVAQ